MNSYNGMMNNNNLMGMMNGMNTMPQQDADKIRTMNEKNSQFRRRGEGNYANYNFNDDDEDEDEEEFGYYPRYNRRGNDYRYYR